MSLTKDFQVSKGVYQEKLRFFTPEAELVLTPEEVAQQAEQEKERAE